MVESQEQNATGRRKTTALAGLGSVLVGVLLAIAGMAADSTDVDGRIAFGVFIAGCLLALAGLVTWLVARQPARPEMTPEQARTHRSTVMIACGAVALVLAFFGLAGGGSPVGLLFALLGVGLLVGGLVIRP